ncbi:phosphopantetheine-binding protein [Kitasatospora sp. MAP5-34]|uniref:phosphopantetheine-binding protein n=1 Tax=Kitasatospora sp. MAP5-34 TaxID=3035102 RepID=UPI0024739F86|nr:phosphopantetheine-binding protein [Kitasatospora sp. MAP5-34]MDH6577389.1 acyl carrier protein [Kitasatospora sp. MAP5-34]
MTASTDTAMDTVLEFLRQCNAEVDTIDWERDLIDARILDSMAFVEFLLVIEEVTGTPVDLATTDVNTLRTLNGISATLTERITARD